MDATTLYQEDRKHSVISYSVTLVVHAVILLLLWFFVIMPPDPPLGEEGGSGSLVSMGSENMGGPDLVPVEEIVPETPPPPTPTEENPALTQDVEEAPEVEKVEEKKVTETKKIEPTKVIKTPVKKPEKPVEKPRVVDEHSLFKKRVNPITGAGSGDGEVPGNEGRKDGVEGGNPDGNGKPGNGGDGEGYGTGSGVGNGDKDGIGTYELRGRSLQRRPDINDNSRETGKVVVAIVVDRMGRVIKATPGQKGTTNLSPSLLEKAKQGAMDARFSAKPDGPEEQFGTMTFIFRFKQ